MVYRYRRAPLAFAERAVRPYPVVRKRLPHLAREAARLLGIPERRFCTFVAQGNGAAAGSATPHTASLAGAAGRAAQLGTRTRLERVATPERQPAL